MKYMLSIVVPTYPIEFPRVFGFCNFNSGDLQMPLALARPKGSPARNRY